MKRILAFLLVVVFMLSMVGCTTTVPETPDKTDNKASPDKTDNKASPDELVDKNEGNDAKEEAMNEATESENEWGLVLTAKNVTATGLTVVFEQNGGDFTGELQTGSWYKIEKNVDGAWQDADCFAEVMWDAIAYLIPSGQKTEFDITWDFLYGELEAGLYRLSKEVMNFRGAGDYDKKIYTVEFTISDTQDISGVGETDAPEKVEVKEVSNSAVSDFAVRLFKNSLEEGENTLISPLSVLVALSMTANGADAETLSQMEAVLGMPIDDLNAWVKTYMEALPETEKYKLSLANSIWVKKTPTFTVEEAFIKTNQDYYGAGIFETPFDTTTLEEINSWVEEKTDGMIKDILDTIPADAIMYLVNALAFDAEWQKMYDEHLIRDGVFTTENGTKRNIKLMYSSENKYLKDEKATGFIKYYKDRKYAFAALLPNEGVTVSEYITSLDGESLNKMLANPENCVVSAAIPKFESEYKVEMSEILQNMGMKDAFNPFIANFTRMGKSTEGNICISRVIHQTYINVDGKGTKAGAATVVEMKAESAMMPDPEPPKEVYLDRPFVYMLIDCEKNLPFFIGTAMDIEESKEEVLEEGKKAEFMNKAAAIDKYSRENFETAITQRDLNQESYNVYVKWQDLLEEIYAYFYTVMSPDEYTDLMENDTEWRAEREKAIEAEGALWEGGSGAPMAMNSLGTSYTRDRCNLLISNME